MNFTSDIARTAKSSRIAAAGSILLVWTALTSAVCSLKSNISSTLTYETGNLPTELAFPRGYKIQVAPFALSDYNGVPSQQFNLTLRLGAQLARYGRLYANCGPAFSEEPLPLKPFTTQSDDVQLSFQGNTSTLNSFMDCLMYMRVAAVQPPESDKLEFRFTTEGSSEVDLLQIRAILRDGLAIQVKTKSNSVILEPNQVFSRSLIEVTEPRPVLNNLAFKLCTDCSRDFFSLSLVGNQLLFQGHAPANLAITAEGRPGMALTFKIYDVTREQEGQTFSFWVEIAAPEGAMTEQQLKAIVFATLVLLVVIVLVIFVCVWLRKERKRAQETVKKEMGEPAVPENVLTKSILEWNKEATTTRDQTNKESALYNPYEKYSLKKKNAELRQQKKGPYSNIEKPGATPTVTDNSATFGGETAEAQVQPAATKTKAGLRGAIAAEGLFQPGRMKLKDSAVSQQEKLLQEQKYLVAQANADSPDPPENLSQLEFSREENLGTEAGKKSKEPEFGDLSKIILNEANLEGEEPGKDLDLKLDEIILKEI